ncbi:MAG: Unknown protein [uncultured Sulfurovum sp.]|uniref:Uncharacterized protein n=1 Tax=uncultured Sulfurovum sp. TaxID=269237 RepID=A0A6S6TKQ1_9BACT|nr:MAG: Unknown protein [uncultured Sulfurovum sp.]
MGGFSSNYEGGYLDFDNNPKWIHDKSKKNDRYAHLRQKKVYHESSSSKYRYLSVLLTPTNLLTEIQQEKKTELYQIDDADVLLKLKHNKTNALDSLSLEVYYENIFIGSVQKVFEDDDIDNTTIVNEFCFLDEELKKVDIIWDGEGFYLKEKNHLI